MVAAHFRTSNVPRAIEGPLAEIAHVEQELVNFSGFVCSDSSLIAYVLRSKQQFIAEAAFALGGARSSLGLDPVIRYYNAVLGSCG